ncbi:MAG: HEPN domain-containing protein, partial [candidate division Zixibacteria bacterium]|nr:HEPN domain-containing protein [candidate division Zixibacteria bacterium]
MRRNRQEEGERWIAQAAEDLRWAAHLAKEGGYHLSCFLAQEVAEKALKGFLYHQGEEIVLGHSVERLCSVAAAYHSEFANKLKRWSILDGYYLPTRYPNSLPDGIPANVYTADAAASAVALAEEAVTKVRELIKK